MNYPDIRQELEIMGFEPLADEALIQNPARYFVHRGRQELADVMIHQHGRATVRFMLKTREEILALCSYEHGLYCGRNLAVVEALHRVKALGLMPRNPGRLDGRDEAVEQGGGARRRAGGCDDQGTGGAVGALVD